MRINVVPHDQGSTNVGSVHVSKNLLVLNNSSPRETIPSQITIIFISLQSFLPLSTTKHVSFALLQDSITPTSDKLLFNICAEIKKLSVGEKLQDLKIFPLTTDKRIGEC
jgi:hypothetical protein